MTRRTPRPTLPVYGHCHTIPIDRPLSPCTLGQVATRHIGIANNTKPINGYMCVDSLISRVYRLWGETSPLRL